jgi:hypothetical protein
MTEIERLQHLAGIMPRTIALEADEADTGDSVTKTVVGHVDDEPDMIRQELYKIGKYAIELYKMLGELPDADLPHWWQSKIVKAGDYISSAKHYLEAELNSPDDVAVVVTPGVSDDLDPSGIS